MAPLRQPSLVQARNRSLSRSKAGIARAVTAPRTPRLSSKRSRDDDGADEYASVSKQVKSSATGPLEFGGFMSASPVPSEPRS